MHIKPIQRCEDVTYKFCLSLSESLRERVIDAAAIHKKTLNDISALQRGVQLK